jgi:hypothetical protein
MVKSGVLDTSKGETVNVVRSVTDQKRKWIISTSLQLYPDVGIPMNAIREVAGVAE